MYYTKISLLYYYWVFIIIFYDIVIFANEINFEKYLSKAIYTERKKNIQTVKAQLSMKYLLTQFLLSNVVFLTTPVQKSGVPVPLWEVPNVPARATIFGLAMADIDFFVFFSVFFGFWFLIFVWGTFIF